MSFFHRNATVILVALLVCVPPWLFGGMRSSALLPIVPWLVALALEAVFFFPQRHGDETSYTARDRVWYEMKRDPLVWASVALAALLTIPFANPALCPHCDAAAIASGLSADPPVKMLPSCVNRMHHLGVMLWIVPALVAAVAVKHALTKDGKLLLLEMVVWNGVALVVLGAVQLAQGAPGPYWCDFGRRANYFFSAFGYPNVGGDYFTTVFLLAAGLWRHRVAVMHEEDMQTCCGQRETHGGGAHRHFWGQHYMLIAMGALFFGVVNTLSRASILIVSVSAFLVFLHAGMVAMMRMDRRRCVKSGAIVLLLLVTVALATLRYMPQAASREMDTVETREIFDRVSGKSQGHTETAMAIWRDYPLFGCGGWGYLHLSPTYAKKIGREWKYAYADVGGVNVHNDYLQILCEHGVAGLALLMAIAVLLLLPVAQTWSALAKAIRFLNEKNQLPPPRTLFVLPAGALFILLAALGTLAHAFADCPFRSAAVFILFYVQLAAVDGYLPYLDNDKTEG